MTLRNSSGDAAYYYALEAALSTEAAKTATEQAFLALAYLADEEFPRSFPRVICLQEKETGQACDSCMEAREDLLNEFMEDAQSAAEGKCPFMRLRIMMPHSPKPPVRSGRSLMDLAGEAHTG
ncbi:hypothetical protein D5S17_35905 [Pseudonocardiaceae bacterium YIM PH 21723]|nr:hypothetical protein D5S17_35905 [Pseudonocardiaceae bacterium YIM PH 21723]